MWENTERTPAPKAGACALKADQTWAKRAEHAQRKNSLHRSTLKAVGARFWVERKRDAESGQKASKGAMWSACLATPRPTLHTQGGLVSRAGSQSHFVELPQVTQRLGRRAMQPARQAPEANHLLLSDG